MRLPLESLLSVATLLHTAYTAEHIDATAIRSVRKYTDFDKYPDFQEPLRFKSN